MFTQVTTLTELIEGMLRGEDDSWHGFQARYGALIWAAARRGGLQPASCDEVVQNVLMALHGGTYDRAKGAFRPYLTKVVVNAIRSEFCQKSSHVDLSAIREFADTDDWLEDIIDEEWAKHHFRIAMRCIAAEYKSRDVDAFKKYAIEGQKPKDVAELLNISIDNLYKIKERILNRIRDLVAAQRREEDFA